MFSKMRKSHRRHPIQKLEQQYKYFYIKHETDGSCLQKYTIGIDEWKAEVESKNACINKSTWHESIQDLVSKSEINNINLHSVFYRIRPKEILVITLDATFILFI